MTLSEKKFLRHAAVEMVPRKHLVRRALPRGVEIRVDASLHKRAQPHVVPELVAPAVETAAHAPGAFHGLSQPPVAPGEHGLDVA